MNVTTYHHRKEVCVRRKIGAAVASLALVAVALVVTTGTASAGECRSPQGDVQVKRVLC